MILIISSTKSISPLTSKPTLYVANIKEDDLYDDGKNIYLQELKEWSEKNNEKVLLSVESSNPNFQNFEVRMGDDV